jgi:hypothetical protein
VVCRVRSKALPRSSFITDSELDPLLTAVMPRTRTNRRRSPSKAVDCLRHQKSELDAGRIPKLAIDMPPSVRGVGGASTITLFQVATGRIEELPGVLPVPGAATVLIGAVVVAFLVPAARASRVDVLQALRSE